MTYVWIYIPRERRDHVNKRFGRGSLVLLRYIYRYNFETEEREQRTTLLSEELRKISMAAAANICNLSVQETIHGELYMYNVPALDFRKSICDKRTCRHKELHDQNREPEKSHTIELAQLFWRRNRLSTSVLVNTNIDFLSKLQTYYKISRLKNSWLICQGEIRRPFVQWSNFPNILLTSSETLCKVYWQYWVQLQSRDRFQFQSGTTTSVK